MTNLYTWFQGKRTYLIAAIVGIQAGLVYMGYTIPDWVTMLEGALGLGAVRAAIANKP